MSFVGGKMRPCITSISWELGGSGAQNNAMLVGDVVQEIGGKKNERNGRTGRLESGSICLLISGGIPDNIVYPLEGVSSQECQW